MASEESGGRGHRSIGKVHGRRLGGHFLTGAVAAILVGAVAALVVGAAPTPEDMAHAQGPPIGTDSVGQEIPSPTLRRLQAAMTAGDDDALAEFWSGIRDSGSPLVEPIEGSPDSMLITFLWRRRGDVRNVVVFGGPAMGADRGSHQLRELDGTDVWFRSYPVHRETRFTYQFISNDPLTPIESAADVEEIFSRASRDPLNPRSFPAGAGDDADHSVVGPGVPLSRQWYGTSPVSLAGRLDTAAVPSRILGDTRRVVVYVPRLLDTVERNSPPHDLDLLVVFDGPEYVDRIGAPAILDHLIASGRIPPTLAVFVRHPDPGTRDRELQCHEPFESFLVDELLPWLSDTYPTATAAARRTVAGASYGGLAAYCAGIRHPDRFGRVLSQSGTFWWSPEGEEEPLGLLRRIPPHGPTSPDVYLSVGRLETPEPLPGFPSQLDAVRTLRDSLLGAGYPVAYHEYEGGHDYLGWREDFVHGLLLLARGDGGEGSSRMGAQGRPSTGGPNDVAGHLLVVNRSSHDVMLLDPAGEALINRFRTGRGPHEIAVGPDHRVAYVANYGMFPTPHEDPIPDGGPLEWQQESQNTVSVLDLRAGSVRETFDLGECDGPHGIAASRDGSRIWVTCERRREVRELDAGTGRLLDSWFTGQEISHIVTASPDDRRIYVANVGSGTVTLIDRSTDEVLTVRTGAGAEGLWVSPDGREVWVANTADNTISVIDGRTGELLESFPSGGAFPVKFAYDPTRSQVWVTNNQSGSVAVFDRASRSLRKIVPLGTTVLGIAADGHGSHVFVSTPRRNRVYVLDAGTGDVLGRIQVGIEPDGLVWIPRR